MEIFVFRDTTISPPSLDMTFASPAQETAISAEEQITSTVKPSMEEADTTITNAPMTAATEVDSVTDVNTAAPTDAILSSTIVGTTILIETPTTTLTDSKTQEPATSTHLTSMTELSTMVEGIEANSVVSSETTTHSLPVSEQNTTMHTVETNSVVPSDTPSETVTTILPMTLPAAAVMTTSNQNGNEMMPPGDTDTPNLSSLASLFTNNDNMNTDEDLAVPSKVDGHAEVDNVLTMSSNEETTRMATSTDSKTDGGDKQTAPLAGVTEPPKPQNTNELDNGNSGCHSISTSFAVLSLAVLYVIV